MASMCPPVSPGKDLMGIGKHCNVKDCHKLDFLPYRCELCKLVFCETHRLLEKHHCTEKYTKDNIVPRCPICSLLVPAKQGQTLDQAMNEHINGGCKKVTQKGKTYTNKCNHPKCKKRELVPMVCKACGLNYCASHRFEDDHHCKGSAAMRNTAANAAAMRRSNTASGARKTTTTNSNNATASSASFGQPRSSVAPPSRFGQPRASGAPKQPAQASTMQHVSEDEAMRLAIAASLAESTSGGASGKPALIPQQPMSPEDADLELALALSASEHQGSQGSPTKSKDCMVM